MSASLASRIRLSICRGVLALVDDGKQMQEVQPTLLAGEARARAERFQNYGFTSVPHEGAEAIALAVGGSRSHVVVIAADDRRYRKRDLQAGEVAIYTDQGDYVHIKRGGTIEVKASTKVIADTPRVECTGDLHVAGDITCDGNVSDAAGSMQEMRDQYNAHTHGSTPTPTPEMS